MPEVTKVAYGLTIGDLKYGNSRPGVVEASLRPGETMEDALDELDERLNAWHRKRYPHLYEERKSNHFHGLGPVPENQIPSPMPIIDKKWDRFEVDLDNAPTREKLEEVINSYGESYGLFPAKFLPIINTKRQSLKPIN